MLDQHLDKRLNKAHRLLNWLWWTTTLILLLLLSLFSWKNIQYKNQKALSQAATLIRIHLDDSLDNVLEDVYAMPIHGKHYHECAGELLGLLQQIGFNHPTMSGIAVLDRKNHLYCSTIPSRDLIQINSKKYRLIHGPISNPFSPEPYYLIQQRIGYYDVGVYMLANGLGKALETYSRSTNQVMLWDANQKQAILTVHRDGVNAPWQISTKTDLDKPSQYSASPLLNIPELSVLAVANDYFISYTFWPIEGLIILLFLVFAIVVYFILRRSLNSRYSFPQAIREAINQDDFFPVYQGLYDFNQQKYIGAEVLIRWEYRQGEFIRPDLFIDEAEDSGLIIPMTYQLVDKVFKECKDFMHQNPEFHLSINISQKHLQDQQFLYSIHGLCQQHGILPQQIILEITEREVVDLQNSKIIDQIHHLRSFGFSLAIDDFGTGHASIRYLQHIPFDYLKIDQIYVQAIGTDSITANLIESIIHLGKNLKLRMIAEGVENQAQLDYLVRQEIHLIQGWYYTKALNWQEFHALLQGKNP